MRKIIKAVIPAAGLGTRLGTITQIIPKELLPIGTKPSLHFILEEAIQSGIEEIILILSLSKESAMTHLREFFPQLIFHFVIQEKALGLGHAVGLAEKIVGDQPFLVLLPDIIIDHKIPVASRLTKAFEKTGKSVNATMAVSKEEVSSVGIYEMASGEGDLYLAKRVIEKPSLKEAPSNLAVVGRYLFTSEIFSILKKTPPGRNGEIQLADAMDTLAKRGNLYACKFEGEHFDIGNPIGWIRANLYFGIKEYGERVYQGII